MGPGSAVRSAGPTWLCPHSPAVLLGGAIPGRRGDEGSREGSALRCGGSAASVDGGRRWCDDVGRWLTVSRRQSRQGNPGLTDTWPSDTFATGCKGSGGASSHLKPGGSGDLTAKPLFVADHGVLLAGLPAGVDAVPQAGRRPARRTRDAGSVGPRGVRQGQAGLFDAIARCERDLVQAAGEGQKARGRAPRRGRDDAPRADSTPRGCRARSGSRRSAASSRR